MDGEHDGLVAASGSDAHAAPTPGVAGRQALCVEILTEGHPAAFCEFFRITHAGDRAISAELGGIDASGTQGATNRPNGADDGPADALGADSASAVGGAIPAGAMEFLKDNLVAADLARRYSDGATVVSSYTNLARFFEERRDFRSAVRYLSEARAAALAVGAEGDALAATASLGEAFSHLGDHATAARYHERALEMAGGGTEDDAARSVQLSLVGVYRALAHAAEQAGETERAVGLLHKCLGAARAGGDRAAEGDVHHRLGLAHETLGKPHDAMRFHATYKEVCNELGDAAGEGRACAALARTYQDVGDLDGAVSNLEQFLELSRHGDPELHARACISLGVIHHGMGEHERAIAYFERGFEIARSLSDRALLDVARINLGVARGKARAPKFFEAINADLRSLLQFKSTRTPLGGQTRSA
eukprot:PRCOL_00005564-RA